MSGRASPSDLIIFSDSDSESWEEELAFPIYGEGFKLEWLSGSRLHVMTSVQVRVLSARKIEIFYICPAFNVPEWDAFLDREPAPSVKEQEEFLLAAADEYLRYNEWGPHQKPVRPFTPPPC
jgi:hypothetical protein